MQGRVAHREETVPPWVRTAPNQPPRRQGPSPSRGLGSNPRPANGTPLARASGRARAADATGRDAASDEQELGVKPGVTSEADDDESDERALVARAQDGDAVAVRELYERYAASVHRYAILPLVHDRVLAEDLLADTFVRAMENIGRFRWQGKGVLPWLIRIAKNLALDHLRRAGRLAAWPEGLEQFVADGGQFSGEAVAAEREVTALLRDRIGACLEHINPRYERVLRLRLVEGMARDLAAAEMEVSVGTLDVLLFRACKAFRKIYVERYGEAPRIEFGEQ
jgi:RNA polymerase sigma-70 factor (ECF subfamily)